MGFSDSSPSFTRELDQATEKSRSQSLKTFAKAAIRKHRNLLYSREVDILSREPKWVPAEEGLEYLHHDGSSLLRQTLAVIQESYPGGKLYFRKIHIGEAGVQVNWQVKFEHKSRSCLEQARWLKDAARKVKSYLDFVEPESLDPRFSELFSSLGSKKRFKGARILFKEGKGKDWYPWKVRVEHDKYGFTKVSNTLKDAIEAMISHLEYEEPDYDSEETGGLVWQRSAEALTRFPKCRLFYRSVIVQNGPHGEPETQWLVKIDHPIRGVQFEAQSRLLDEAAGQVYDYLQKNGSIRRELC